MSSILSANKQEVKNTEDIEEAIYAKFSNVANISNSLSGNYCQNIDDSIYTSSDDVIDSIIFDYAEIPRLIDLEEELRIYESKHKMKSEDFYKNWKTNPAFDNLEFNQWARLYRFLNYAREN